MSEYGEAFTVLKSYVPDRQLHVHIEYTRVLVRAYGAANYSLHTFQVPDGANGH